MAPGRTRTPDPPVRCRSGQALKCYRSGYRDGYMMGKHDTLEKIKKSAAAKKKRKKSPAKKTKKAGRRVAKKAMRAKKTPKKARRR